MLSGFCFVENKISQSKKHKAQIQPTCWYMWCVSTGICLFGETLRGLVLWRRLGGLPGVVCDAGEVSSQPSSAQMRSGFKPSTFNIVQRAQP